jgi:hypothetical protein
MKLKETQMRKLGLNLVILCALAAAVSACAYGGVAKVGKKQVVVLRNDAFLFGALRKAFVCKVNSSGLSQCSTNEAP